MLKHIICYMFILTVVEIVEHNSKIEQEIICPWGLYGDE